MRQAHFRGKMFKLIRNGQGDQHLTSATEERALVAFMEMRKRDLASKATQNRCVTPKSLPFALQCFARKTQRSSRTEGKDNDLKMLRGCRMGSSLASS